MLFLTEAEVRSLLPMPEAIRLVGEAFTRLAAGQALNHPRRRLALPTRSVLHYMAASDGPYFGAKIYSTHPVHGAHFILLLYRSDDAQLLAVIQANYLGQIRTGAVTALATRLMASPGAADLAVIGSGFQAQTQLAAVAAVLPLTRVRVWSRSPEKRAAFAATFDFPVEPAATAEAAVRGASIVITATSAGQPVVEDAWIGPGTHINAMGSNQASRRELPGELVRRAATIVVDSREQARMESGDLLLALDPDGWNGVVELPDVVAGRTPGRFRPGDVTLFKSNGLAVEDVICAGWVYERATQSGAGRRLPAAHS